MGRRRTNPGRVALFQDARGTAWEFRSALLPAWAVLLGATLVMNLPWWPVYLRGLGTSVLLTTGVWLTLWLVWYGGGLGARLEGTWAEEWTAEELDKAGTVLQTIPNLRFEKFDIDNAVIARHGVYLLEVKKHRQFYPGVLEHDLTQFAINARTATSFLTRAIKTTDAPPKDLITPVPVIWGKAGRELTPGVRTTPTGDVVVLGGEQLRTWLDAKGNGYIGRDYAATLADEIRLVAEQREVLHAPDSLLARWFARVK